MLSGMRDKAGYHPAPLCCSPTRVLSLTSAAHPYRVAGFLTGGGLRSSLPQQPKMEPRSLALICFHGSDQGVGGAPSPPPDRPLTTPDSRIPHHRQPAVQAPKSTFCRNRDLLIYNGLPVHGLCHFQISRRRGDGLSSCFVMRSRWPDCAPIKKQGRKCRRNCERVRDHKKQVQVR